MTKKMFEIDHLIARKQLERVHFFPVRHYSPASAIHVERLIHEVKPTAILIEGPFDFNERIEELGLEHELPISIFSYVRYEDNRRASAFYPFCHFSPEWVALRHGLEHDMDVQFIDKPWQDMSSRPAQSNRYARRVYPQTSYIESLAQRLGVETFDECWDTMFELDATLTTTEYIKRAHLFCHQLRFMCGETSPMDKERESFMAKRIELAMEKHPKGNIVVVTGGFHSSALYSLLLEQTLPHLEVDPTEALTLQESQDVQDTSAPQDLQEETWEEAGILDQGITLTPFTYERIDKMSGYASGLHGPAFYEHVYACRKANEPLDAQTLLYQIVDALRAKNQVVSTADVIAVETTAHALATMRGRQEVWHSDLLDGIKAAIIKQALDDGADHPMLQMAREVFCGTRQGVLAEGTDLPPLVHDAHRQLGALALMPNRRTRTVTLDLYEAEDRQKSALLHKLQQLNITGFNRTQGPDHLDHHTAQDQDETWRLSWSPEFEGTLIERALYGPDVEQAAGNRLIERAAQIERDAHMASVLVVDAARMNLTTHTQEILLNLQDAIRHDADFIHLGKALGNILYLHLFDDVLGHNQTALVHAILSEAYMRAMWLFESLGHIPDQDRPLLESIYTLFFAHNQCRTLPFVDEENFIELLERTSQDQSQMPLVQGACVGQLYTQGHVAHEDIIQSLRSFFDPMALGDFLIGMFRFARESVQHDPRILATIDLLVMEKHDDHFMALVPGLRLAFTYFTPREKHNLLRLLFPTRATKDTAQIERLSVGQEDQMRIESLCQDVQNIITTYDLGVPIADTTTLNQIPTPVTQAPKTLSNHDTVIAHTTALYDEETRLVRWRLVMGVGTQQYFGDLPPEWARREQLIGFLYDREYSHERNIRSRQGSMDHSNLTVPDWINGVHELFPKAVIERLEKDAMERYQIDELVTKPELLARAEPNQTLLKAILKTKHLMNDEVMKLAMSIVKKVVAQLMDVFSRQVQSVFSGAANRQQRSFLRVAKNFDAKETIRRNLKHMNTQGQMVIEDPYFFSRIRRQVDRWQLIMVVDESGSMLDSVIHSAITASIFWNLKALKTHLVIFDTEVVDLTDCCVDPVETLMKVQLGGGTDIGKAMRYAQTLVTNPNQAIIVLVTDFYEGAAPELLLGTTQQLIESGVTVLGLAALDDQANPNYDQHIAQNMVNLGAEVGAMTPGELAQWVAQKVN